MNATATATRTLAVEAMSEAVTAAHDVLMRARQKATADALTDAWDAVRGDDEATGPAMGYLVTYGLRAGVPFASLLDAVRWAQAQADARLGESPTPHYVVSTYRDGVTDWHEDVHVYAGETPMGADARALLATPAPSADPEPEPLTFWQSIRRALDLVEQQKPDTFDAVAAILRQYGDPEPRSVPASTSPDAAFFAGGGGDDRLRDSLRAAGWRVVWADAWYYYAARHPETGEALTYVEGDVYRGDRRAA